MTDLLNKIKGVGLHRNVAKVLQEAGLRSDSDIRSLTRAELHQLLPGKEDLKLRRTIFEMIKQEPVGQLLRDITSFIPNEDFQAALTGNGVLVDYLCILKDMQTQVKHIQSFQEAHIRFLEEKKQNQPDPESANNLKEPIGDVPPQEAHDLLEEIRNRERDAADVLREADLCIDSDIRSLTREELLELFPGTKNLKLRRRIFEMIQNQKPVKQLPPTGVNNGMPSKSSSDDRMDTSDQQPPPKETEAVNKWKAKLVYQMVVTGTTFDAHVQLMEKVKNEVKDQFDLVQSYSDNYDVTIVFCPIVSRMGPDVESALRDVKVSSGDKPVILVLMHHAYEAKFIPNVQQGANVQLQVNVFFHETKHGLLHCRENGAVVCEITKYLKEIPITNAQVVAAAVAELPGGWESASCPPRCPNQTPSPPPSNQKPVKQPPPTRVNNGNPSKGSSVDRMDTSDQQPRPKKEPSKVVNKWKGKLMYQMVVTGTTFDAHVQLMEKVKKDVKDQFDLVQSNSDDYDVTIVFCPIVSHMGPDVDSAMRDVKGDKPVILVLMHHAYETKFIPNVQQGANVQLQVNVFFHETKHGLLHCRENGAAVCEITKYLKEIPIPNAQVVAAGHSGISDQIKAWAFGPFTSKD